MMDGIRLFSIKGIAVKLLPMISLLLFSFGEIFCGTKYIIIVFLFVIPFVISFFSKYGYNRYLLNFVLLVFLGSIFNLFFTKNGIGGTILFLANVALALFCLTNMKYVKYLSLLVLCYNLIFLYNKLFIELVNPNYIYENLGLSRNHPGMLLVIWTSFWGFSKYLTEKKVSIVLPILSVVIAFFLEGRSSLGVLLVLSVVSLCVRNSRYIYIVIILLLSLLCIYWDVILDVYMMTSFSENSLESSRFSIWQTYFESLDLISFFGGLELSEIPLIRSYGNNPHNAILNFHYRMGILGVISIIAIIISSFKKYIRISCYIPILYLSCLIVRFMFDSCINTTYDFILYTMLFYPLLIRNKLIYSLYLSQVADLKIKRIKVPYIIKPIEKIINFL